MIMGIRPTSGRVGTRFTIRGRRLLETVAANRLSFTDAIGQELSLVPFAPVLATADSLQVRVPVGAGTGPLTLYARLADNVPQVFGILMTPSFSVFP